MATPLYQLKAEFFKTLGHPARIKILELLAQREWSVAELLPEIGLEASHLSQQLGVLRRAGVVTSRKQGNSVIYAMSSPDMSALMAVARKVLTDMLNDQADLLEHLQDEMENLQGDELTEPAGSDDSATSPVPEGSDRAVTSATSAARASAQGRAG